MACRTHMIAAAVLAAMSTGCAATAPPPAAVAVRPATVVEALGADPALPARRERERLAAEATRCEAERIAYSQRGDGPDDEEGALPRGVLVAFVRVEPLVLAGLASADWLQVLERDVLYLRTEINLIGLPSSPRHRARLIVDGLWYRLLMSDADHARGRLVHTDFRRCARAAGPCACRAPLAAVESRSAQGSILGRRPLAPDVAQLDRIPVDPVDHRRVALIRAWSLPPDRVIAALDLLAEDSGTARERRAVLLLAARASIEQNDIAGAIRRLQRVPTIEGSAGDPARDLLLAICHLIAGRGREAHRLLALTATSGRAEFVEAARAVMETSTGGAAGR